MRDYLDVSTTTARTNFDGVRLLVEYVAPRRVWQRRRQLKSHSKAQLKRLAAGIDRHGFNVPLIVDEELGLVSGYARLQAAEQLGLQQVPVIRVTHLTKEQLRLFAIFENRIAEEGEWNEPELVLEFAELKLDQPQLDLSDSGFHIAEIDAMAGRARTAELADLDRVQEPDPKVSPVSRVGDLWRCGRHSLICGDSTDPTVIARLVEDVRIRQLLTDPPFNLPTRAFSSSDRHGDFQMGAGELDEAGFVDFLARFVKAAQPVLMDGAWVYAFMDHQHIGQLLAAAHQAELTYAQLLVWVKGQAGMGSFYRSGHELVGVFRHGQARGCNNIMLGAHGRNRSNVLSYPGVMGKGGGGAKALKLHPTVKNTAMIADLMLDASAPGEAILDSFGGSGTTLIAAEKVERTAYLCELSPGYVDVALQRFDALGGAQATLVATGQTLAEVAADRAVVPGEVRP